MIVKFNVVQRSYIVGATYLPFMQFYSQKNVNSLLDFI